MNVCKVMITSVGRRNYLVDWFKAVSEQLDTEVIVVTADGDPTAPAMGTGSESVVLPLIGSSAYPKIVHRSCTERGVHLLLSANDYDVAVLGNTALSSLREVGVTVAVPPPATLHIVEDKFQTFKTLQRAGIAVPQTALVADAASVVQSDHACRYIVKHRYGSGSSGVFAVDAPLLAHAAELSAATAPGRAGAPPEPEVGCLDRVVIQERVDGDEYGVDVVCDFDGNFCGVLARRKLRMRAGETDQAITVDPAPFVEVAQALASTLQFSGITDVDIIMKSDGTPVVIDINPRFGGGYPFSHMAGANVPACYIAWTLGREIDPAWLQSEISVRSSKYTAIRRVSS